MKSPGLSEGWRASIKAEPNAVLDKAKTVVSGKGLIGEIRSRLAGRNIWGQDKIVEADHRMTYEHSYKGNDFQKEFLENSISANLRDQAPEMVDILVSEFGDKWDTDPSTPLEILKQSWYITEAVDRREAHGHEVNTVLRKYWENPVYNPDTHERIFIPEDKTVRRELLERAQRYNTARVDTRARMLSMMQEIADAKGYEFDSQEYLALRNKMRTMWESEERERAEGCVFLASDESSVLNMYDVDHDIKQGKAPEIDVIAQKIEEISNVDDKAKLLSEAGISIDPDKGYILNAAKPRSGAFLMLRGRMGQRQHLQTAQKCWDSIPSGSEKNADIVLMNALGLESLVKSESMGREMILSEIYMARGLELLDDGEHRSREKLMNSVREAGEVAGSGEPRIVLKYFCDSMREINELYYEIAASTSNLIRLKTGESGSSLRRVGERMASWIDRISSRVVVSVDRYFAKASNRGQKIMSQTQASRKSGRVNFDIPLEESEGES